MTITKDEALQAALSALTEITTGSGVGTNPDVAELRVKAASTLLGYAMSGDEGNPEGEHADEKTD